MQRLVVLGALILIVGVGGGYYLLNQRGALVTPPVLMQPSASVTEKNPFGVSRDKNDPGEQHFSQGRYPEAVAFWMDRAKRGDPQAAHRLGVEYMDGKPWVVARDYSKAMAYHLQAARAGNALSMFDIGSMHEYGQGVAKNISQAARWYGHSAEYGLAQGQYNFATMLEQGEGVAKDDIEAYKFFVLAARSGFTGIPYDNSRLVIDNKAPTPVELMQRRLSPAQIREGTARADAFKVASGPLAKE